MAPFGSRFTLLKWQRFVPRAARAEQIFAPVEFASPFKVAGKLLY
jgi:hypothetical protein